MAIMTGNRRNGIWMAIFAIFFALPALMSAVRLYTDWLWFISVGYESVFTTIILTRIKLGLALGAAFMAFMALNLFAADRLSRVGYITLGNDAVELPGSETLGRNIRMVMLGAAGFLAVILALEASTRWDLFIRYSNPAAFGAADPVFNLDISFFVFSLPFLNYIYQWSFITLLLAAGMSVGVYAYKRGFVVTSKGVHFRSAIFSHLSALLMMAALLKAWGYKLMAFNLMATSRGFVTGPGFVDTSVRMPLLHILSILALALAVAMAANIFIRSWKPIAAAAILFIVASAAGAAYPEIIQKFRVSPNEISMERPFIARQIEHTRTAYDLNRIETIPFDADRDISPKQIADNNLTIKNIRLWDPRPLLQTYRQLQEIRTYYSFANVDIDRYMVDGEYRQVMISARELSYEKLPARIWINEHLTFTHGYGAAVSPVNSFTPDGMPHFFVKDIPPVSVSETLKITQPRIYYGELANDYVFVNTKADEFDYPMGETNVLAEYDGAGGVKLDSTFKKAAFALRFSSLASLLNSDIKKDSKVMLYRNILGSGFNPGLVNRIMPLVHYDMNPYVFIDAEGRMKWLIDGYTISNTFPYSQHFGKGEAVRYNYIRNSVKAVVDAYDGTTEFYMFDETDPIIKAYAAMFPGLFKPAAEMPASVRAHLRYPVDYFTVQSRVFSSYHMTDPLVFYNKEDLWTTPREMFFQNEQEVEPYYNIMKLPGGDKEEYVLMLPFTPARRDNISAWMCARNDGDDYGRLVVYTFPKKKLVFGPFQVEARIDQDAGISQQISLWSQSGSQVVRGNMLVIPIENSLLYVEPLFLQAERGDIPELKRVIVSNGDRVVMEETLEKAISGLVGVAVPETPAQGAPKPAPASSADSGYLTIDQAVDKALEHIESAKRRIRELDWNGFGGQIDAAEKTLKEIKSRDANRPD